MGKRKLRMNKDFMVSRTWQMKLRSDEDGWICSRMEGEMLHKNVEIRSNWKKCGK